MSQNPASAASLAMVGPSLSGGGAERVLTLLAAGLAERGHRVAVITIYGPELDFWRLPASVERVSLRLGGDTVGWWAKVVSNVRRVRGLRQALRRVRPHAIVSFMSRTNVLALLAARPLGIPVLATEHTDPRMEPLEPIWELLRRWTYRRAAQVVSVSSGVDAYFGWLAAEKRCVIPNPVSVQESTGQAGSEGLRRPVVVGMGRLEREKGFDLLIEAFARIAHEFPQWSLTIFGQGSQRTSLQQQAAEHGLTDRVRFPGAVFDPLEALRHADLFVLSSRYEGFGLALVEAMACGVPVVAFDCPSGPREILRHGADGLLVPAQSVEGLAKAMATLMRDPQRRSQLGQAAQQSAARFHIERVLDAWQGLIARVAAS